MLAKLIAIARKDVYTTFQDRQALVIMFVAPLALSLIIGLSFGSADDVSIDPVPVVVVNADEGAALPGSDALSLGDVVQNAFVPTTDPATEADYRELRGLITGSSAAESSAAREQVEAGDLAAVITIGADFTNAILTQQPAPIDVYFDSGRSIGSSIVLSVVRSLSNGLNTAVLAQRIGPAALASIGADLGQDQAAISRAAQQVAADAMNAGNAQPIMLRTVDLEGETRGFDALQYFAPSMAILFMTFGMASGATTILTEQRRWTLQRIISTPTPRWAFLGGKLLGIYLTGVLQMIGLILSTELGARALGRTEPVWGTNVAGIALVVLAVVFAGTSLGLLIAAAARTLDQASSISTVVIFLLGMIGGSFFTIGSALPSLLPKLTLNYWGIQGFVELSHYNATLGEIVPHVLALLGLGAVMFAISLWRFNRRLDV